MSNASILAYSVSLPANTLPPQVQFISLVTEEGLQSINPTLQTKIAEARRYAIGNGFVTPTGFDPVKIIEIKDSSGSEVTGNLNGFATIEIPYSDANNDNIVDDTSIRADTLKIFRLNPVTERWEIVDDGGINRADLSSKVIRAEIRHFSVYTLLSPSSIQGDLSQVSVYPIPWKKGRGGRFDSANVTGCGNGLIFNNLTADCTIRIYNIQGDLVRELTVASPDNGCKAWDGKNNSGNNTKVWLCPRKELVRSWVGQI